MIKNYLLITKPGIIFGNLITTAGAFFLASKGQADLALLATTVSGISLVVASGCVLNNCIDRKLDQKMTRTRNRVLAKGLMTPKAAVFYASLLGIAGMALLRVATNTLCVAVVLTGFAVYVGVYSLYMKRRSVYGALIGSLAGAAPPVAGYCAASGCFDMGALILLAIFSLWQIPHCYAIAIFQFDDYAAAGIPVLPVKQGIEAAKKHILCYIPAFTAAALMLTFDGYTGCSTLGVAASLGLSWLYMAWSGFRTSDDQLWAKKLFVLSILNVFVLSIMMSLDFTVSGAAGMFITYAP